MRLFLFFSLLWPALSFAQQALKAEVDRDHHGRISQIVVKGATLGSKPAPLLYDTADATYEKGLLNQTLSDLLPGRLIEKVDTTFNSKSPWGNVGAGVYIRDNPAMARHSKAGAYYYGDNAKANLQNPRVHSRAGTPQESKKLYVSWWFKQQNETRDYFTVRLANVADTFNPKEGDEFSINVGNHWSGVSVVRGRVIAYEPSSQKLIANFYDQNNTNLIKSKTIRLDKNGATAVFERQLASQGANKYIRVWESDGSAGTFRLSWTNTQLYVAEDEGATPRSHIPAREWNHLEILVDQTKKTVTTKVNSKIDYHLTYADDIDVAGHSPTIGLIGFDASIDIIQEIWMDDIYLDNSFRRVTLGNAPKHSEVTHEEVQFYDSWEKNEIRFTPNYGSMSRKEPAYIYVYSEDGSVNANGIPFESRPKQPIPN